MVVVSILPQQQFVEQIAGEFPIEVMVMIPPGASPATYELSPNQMQKINSAKAYFKLGSGLPFEENWLSKIESINPEMKIYDCSEGIELLSGIVYKHDDHEHHGTDPHIWCSPLNAKVMVDNITRGLIEIEPEHKDVYEKNSPIYKNKLDQLHMEIKNKLAIINKTDFIVFHPSWGYFAEEYGLSQIAIEVEGKEPRADDLRRLIELCREKNIKTVFTSPQFNIESAEMIATEIGGEVVYIDPLAKNYISNLSEVASKFAEALR
jgi:zinc transport system substrate-binding protein